MNHAVESFHDATCSDALLCDGDIRVSIHGPFLVAVVIIPQLHIATEYTCIPDVLLSAEGKLRYHTYGEVIPELPR